MKKEFTIDNFTKSDWYKSVVSYGTWSNHHAKWDVNYSAILTELIQNAGRWCERYASDLFIDWMTIEEYLRCKDIENRSFLFGFRQDGVDNATFVISRFNHDEYTMEYRAIYRLDLEFVEDPDKYYGTDEVRMALYRVK